MERYLDPHQARLRPSTAFEDLLGDALERAFAAGHSDIDHVIAQLNQTGPRPPSDDTWTPENFQSLMKKLGV
jgi:hypothetical protein